MSYCTVEDIGGNVDYQSVLEAAWVIEEYTSPYTLWAPSANWTVQNVVFSREAEDVDADCTYGLVSISQIEAWDYAIDARKIGDALTVSDSADRILKDRRGFRLPEDARQWALDGYALRFTGVRGYCTLDDLSAGEEVLAGQTVIRAGAAVFFEEDGTAMADDQLVVGPSILRKCAISIAKRLTFLKRDKRARFDDIDSQVVDGWEFALEAFTP